MRGRLSQLIFNRRSALGLTIAEVAEASGGCLKYTNVNDIELGRSLAPEPVKILGLIRALGLDPAEIIAASVRDVWQRDGVKFTWNAGGVAGEDAGPFREMDAPESIAAAEIKEAIRALRLADAARPAWSERASGH